MITERALKPKKNKTGAIKRGQVVFLIVMLSLPVISWLVFSFTTKLYTITLAFQLPAGGWTLNNFKIFFDNLTYEGNALNIAVKNTFIYFGTSIFIIFPGSLIISYFLYKRILGYKAFRVIFYLPAIIPTVVLVNVFKEFIKPWGPLGELAKLINISLPPTGLLGDAKYATATIVFYVIWTGFCGNILLFSGAMSRIPLDLLESAKIEGCGPFREMLQIVLPLIWPTISTVIIFTFTGLFTSSGPILLMTKGQFGTTTLSYWIFANVLGDGMGSGGKYNLVATAGLFFTLIGVPIILFVRWALEKIPKVEY